MNILLSIIKILLSKGVREHLTKYRNAYLVVVGVLLLLLGKWMLNNHIDSEVESKVDAIVKQIELESSKRTSDAVIKDTEVTEKIIVEVLDKQTELRDRSNEIQERVIADVNVIEITNKETPDVVDDLVAERIVDGMWEAYCNPVGDRRTCP